MSRHSFILAAPCNSSPIAGPWSYRYVNRCQPLPQQWVARGCMSISGKVAPLVHLFSEFKSFSIKVFGFLFIPLCISSLLSRPDQPFILFSSDLVNWNGWREPLLCSAHSPSSLHDCPPVPVSPLTSLLSSSPPSYVTLCSPVIISTERISSVSPCALLPLHFFLLPRSVPCPVPSSPFHFHLSRHFIFCPLAP